MTPHNDQLFWNAAARLYAPLQEHGNRRLYQQLTELIGKLIPSDARVLEVGCGTGQLTIPLCEHAALWEACDYAPKMVERAKKRCADLPVSFSVQDAANLSYADATWDMVLIANTLHVLPDPATTLEELRRVLVPGGTLVAPTFVSGESLTEAPVVKLLRHTITSYHAWTAAELDQLVRHAGFEVILSETIDNASLPERLLVAVAAV